MTDEINPIITDLLNKSVDSNTNICISERCANCLSFRESALACLNKERERLAMLSIPKKYRNENAIIYLPTLPDGVCEFWEEKKEEDVRTLD